MRYFAPASAVASRTRETFLVYTHPFVQHLCFGTEARYRPVSMQQYAPEEGKETNKQLNVRHYGNKKIKTLIELLPAGIYYEVETATE